MIQYSELVKSIGEAITKFQDENFEHNDAAVCIAVKACTPDAAEQLGIKLEATIPYYAGENSDTERVIYNNSRAVSLQHLALALVDKKMREEGYRNNDEPIISADIDKRLSDCGDVKMCAICTSKPNEDDIETPRWALVFIAVTDISTIRMTARSAVHAGMCALKEYVRGAVKDDALIVNP